MIRNLIDLQQIRNSHQPVIEARNNNTETTFNQVMVCTGTGCSSSGSRPVIEDLKKELINNGLEKEVRVFKTGDDTLNII